MELRRIGIGEMVTLTGTGIQVFHLDLDEGMMTRELDADELRVCSSFVTEQLRHRYRQSHLATRAILAAHLGTTRDSLRFSGMPTENPSWKAPRSNSICRTRMAGAPLQFPDHRLASTAKCTETLRT